MEAKVKKVYLSKFKESEEKIFINRDNGLEARKELELDELEQEDVTIQVLLPGDIWAINPSFFGGMFEESIKKFQNDFWNKYQFLYTNGDHVNAAVQSSLNYDYDYVIKHME
jgi:hypothetical protein